MGCILCLKQEVVDGHINTDSRISEEQVFENVRIILVEPQHPGNIGAGARAMKNMGLMTYGW